ncbi:MAG: helix-turn-helix domain-containing protein, partial [Methanophagales archaeon]|nr:helix-turn-helix domain-containing protein [Methanophagales archaeon]
SSSAYYTDYHTVFYLPDVIRLGRINCSPTMQYFVTVSNGSFVIDVQGYDVERPMTEIEYQEQLEQPGQPGRGDTNINTNITVMQPLLIIVPIAVLTALLVLYFYAVKKRSARGGAEEDKAGRKGAGIEISSDMMRVMETLTERERGIVNALLKHNGEMTQADLRYETGIPKSSLTGILRNLERRNIINKKEWGRTNVIELSEWFLGGKGKK